MQSFDKIIVGKVKVTLVFAGYGFLTLTENALVWNKSAGSYIAFGVAAAFTMNHLFIPLEDIREIGKYTYLPGGGLIVRTKELKEYKIAFSHKKDFKTVYEYLSTHIGG